MIVEYKVKGKWIDGNAPVIRFDKDRRVVNDRRKKSDRRISDRRIKT